MRCTLSARFDEHSETDGEHRRHSDDQNGHESILLLLVDARSFSSLFFVSRLKHSTAEFLLVVFVSFQFIVAEPNHFDDLRFVEFVRLKVDEFLQLISTFIESSELEKSSTTTEQCFDVVGFDAQNFVGRLKTFIELLVDEKRLGPIVLHLNEPTDQIFLFGLVSSRRIGVRVEEIQCLLITVKSCRVFSTTIGDVADTFLPVSSKGKRRVSTINQETSSSRVFNASSGDSREQNRPPEDALIDGQIGYLVRQLPLFENEVDFHSIVEVFSFDGRNVFL